MNSYRLIGSQNKPKQTKTNQNKPKQTKLKTNQNKPKQTKTNQLKIMTAMLRDDVASIIASDVMKIKNAKPPDTDRVLLFDLSVADEGTNGSSSTVHTQTVIFSRNKTSPNSWKATVGQCEIFPDYHFDYFQKALTVER